jgi:hypothetical protein
MHRRLGARLPLGGLLGAIVGAIVGTLVGLLFFDRTAAVLTSILASAVFGLGVGMLVAGYSSLESPDPGAEPSDTARLSCRSTSSGASSGSCTRTTVSPWLRNRGYASGRGDGRGSARLRLVHADFPPRSEPVV